MKVTTDGCLFGAIIDHEEAKQILDIGAGTGLLSLMMSQKICGAMITAVEIDRGSAIECAINFEASRWKDRLKIINSSIQELAEKSSQKFDLIVSNPPFYQNHFLPKNNNQSIARHQESLTLTELVKCVDSLLEDDGVFYVILPSWESENLLQILKSHKLLLKRRIEVYNFGGCRIFRVILLLTREDTKCHASEELIIRDHRHEYTPEFKELMAPYYL